MSDSTKQFKINSLWLVSIILLSSIFVTDNAFSRKSWNRDFTKVVYDPTENSITITFEVLDYYFGPNHESAFLKLCDFYFTTDGIFYKLLMRTETKNQVVMDWTALTMKYRNYDAKLQFSGCFEPANNTMWTDYSKEVNISVKNTIDGQITFIKGEKKYKFNHYIAFFTVKWLLGEKFKYVERIRLNGTWKVSEINQVDDIHNIYYDIPNKFKLKPMENQFEKKQVKVARKANEIVITGTKNGEKIKVYNATGSEVQSTVSTSDVVNIKLPKNQIYFVNIKHTCYKVAM